jgi:hypothetical protein
LCTTKRGANNQNRHLTPLILVFMSQNIPLFSKFYPVSLFLFVSVSALVNATFRGLGNDFPVFYRAGIAARHLEDPWATSIDVTYAAYLNGPISSVLLGIISILEYDLALLLVRVATVALVPILLFFLNRRFGIFPHSQFWQISTLIILSYPVRANLEYGQLFIIFFTIAALPRLITKTTTTRLDIISGITIATAVDYKPHVFLILLPLVLMNKKVLIGFSGAIFVGAVISSIMTKQFPFVVWASQILKRSQSIGESSDQMGLNGIFHNLGLHWSVTVAVSAVLLSFLILRSRGLFSIMSLEEKSLYIGICILPFSLFVHPTDLFMYSIILSMSVMQNFKSKQLVFLFIGSSFVWSNSLYIALIFGVLTLFILNPKNLREWVSTSFLSIQPVIFSVVSGQLVNWEMSMRHILNFQAVIVSCFLLKDLITCKERNKERS